MSDYTNNKMHAILIDDDSLVHAMWEFSAIKHNKKIRIFATSQQFLEISKNFPYDTPVYIDSNLGEGIKGEIISKEIYEMGFKNIYLATGENSDKFINMPWLKGIMSKSPPWE